MFVQMVVHQDDGGRGEFKGAFDDLADIDRRMVDGAFLLNHVGNDPVALVKKQDAELLFGFKAHSGMAIAQYGGPGTQHGAVHDLALHETQRGRADEFHFGDDRVANPRDFAETIPGGVDDFGEGTELGDQFFCQRLGVAAQKRAEQDEFKKFIVG